MRQLPRAGAQFPRYDFAVVDDGLGAAVQDILVGVHARKGWVADPFVFFVDVQQQQFPRARVELVREHVVLGFCPAGSAQCMMRATEPIWPPA